MNRMLYAFWGASLLLGAIAVWRLQPAATPPSSEPVAAATAEDDGAQQLALGEPIQPLPRTVVVDPRGDWRSASGCSTTPDLSSDGKIACASCHDLSHGGGDGWSRGAA